MHSYDLYNLNASAMKTLLQLPVAEQFTVRSRAHGASGLLFQLWFPDSPNLVHVYDNLRNLANGNSELSIKLNGKTADISLRCNTSFERSWKDVPIEPTEITNVRGDKNNAVSRKFSSLQFMEIIRLGVEQYAQPVPTSEAAPIMISKVVWSETGS